MNLPFLNFYRTVDPDLHGLDAFYNSTVSQLGRKAKRQYCVNLIGRLQADLQESQCRQDMRHIKQWLRAARSEMAKLAS